MTAKKDITGQRFNRLIAIKPQGRSLRGDSLWLCQCDCGNQKVVKYGLLARGCTGSCGCFNKERSGEAHIVNLAGQRFERLLVVRLHSKSKHNKVLWLCQCDCGNEYVCVGSNLSSGITHSCGCLQKEIVRSRSGENHPNFKKYISEEERRLKRNIPGYARWKRSVKKLANYTCKVCGYIGTRDDGSLVSHHLHNFRDYPELRTEISNGACLCGPCHNLFHSRYGVENNTLEQFVEFMNSRYKNRMD
jgi:5-methylcytosine-specific restriction endonuclease McrA